MVLKVLGVVVVILFFLLCGVACFIDNAIVKRKSPWYEKLGHDIMNPSITKKSPSLTDEISRHQRLKRDYFWEKRLTKILTVKSKKGLQLHASLFSQSGHQWVLCIHGYRSDGKSDMGYVGEQFFEQGYNVLIPDLQAHGKSEGEVIGMGKLEQEDIELWLRQILAIDPLAEIILFGGSMGATATLLATGNPFVQKHVACFVADCGYSSMTNIFTHIVKDSFHMPTFPIIKLAMFFSRFVGHYAFSDISTKASLALNQKPILIIHGTGDQFVPYSESQLNFSYINSEKELLLVDKAPHLSSSIYEEVTYFSTVFRFIEEKTKGRS